MIAALRTAVKQVFAPFLYRFPPIGLEPPQLGVYINELLVRRDVPGDVAEIGCSVGGTACLASKVVKKYTKNKQYICYDTFGGFVEEQFVKDVLLGTPKRDLLRYTSNSYNLVRTILLLHGCPEVKLVKCDIATVSDDLLSDQYSVVLLDVDLSEPTYYGLKKIYPRLSKGGVILVDDCSDEVAQVWRARKGFEQFCQEMGLVAQVKFGLGVLEK
jgi:hypothetical protein